MSAHTSRPFAVPDTPVRTARGTYQQQAAATFGGRIVDHPQRGRAAAVGDADPHGRLAQGDLHGEPAFLAAGGVAEGVAGQFRRHQDQVVPCGTSHGFVEWNGVFASYINPDTPKVKGR